MSIPISKSKNYKHVDTIKWNVNIQKLKSVDLLITITFSAQYAHWGKTQTQASVFQGSVHHVLLF